jgi:beta-phosphoglucomutase-like phosphatase (HAD superfamily)
MFGCHQQLSSHSAKWAIVTSGELNLFHKAIIFTIVASNHYAPRALHRAGVPIPVLGITASNDVSQGKPHPAPYLAGALRCGVDPKKCKVFTPSNLL